MLPVFGQNNSKLCGKHNNNNEQRFAGFLRFELLFCENWEPAMTKSYPNYVLNSKQFLRELQIILGKLPIFQPKCHPPSRKGGPNPPHHGPQLPRDISYFSGVGVPPMWWQWCLLFPCPETALLAAAWSEIRRKKCKLWQQLWKINACFGLF